MNRDAEGPIEWGPVFYQMQQKGKSLNRIAKEYNMTRDQVAGIIFRYREKRKLPAVCESPINAPPCRRMKRPGRKPRPAPGDALELKPLEEKDTESAVALWIGVIDQALYDATLGVSHYFTYGQRGKRISSHIYVSPKGSSLSEKDVLDGRRFIRGTDGSLRNICYAIGLDYKATQKLLIKKYNECMEFLPEEWRQVIE